MKSHVAIAFLTGGILFFGNPLRSEAAESSKPTTRITAEGSGTNRTDSAAGLGLHNSAATNASASDKQLRAIQKQLASELSATLSDRSSGTNRTARTSNAPATKKQLRAIQKQREQLDALFAQLNRLLTKYPENDKRVQKTRKQIADIQKQLASEPAARLPVGDSGINQIARSSNATTSVSNGTIKSTYAPASGSNASAYRVNTAANAANATSNTNTTAPTNVGLVTPAATSGGSNVRAQTTTTSARTSDATVKKSNAPAKASIAKAADAKSKAAAPITNDADAPSSANLSVNLVSMETLDDKYRLAIGDKLSFRIEEDKNRLEFGDKQDGQSARTAEEPTPLLVTDSGELEVPYIGRFPAENKTCKQLAYELKTALEKDYFYKATVILAVDLKAKSLGRVYLTGAVHEPGPQEIPSDEILTVGKAILRAGGFTDFAERAHVKVTRKAVGSSETETLVVDVAEVFDKGKTDRDLPLKPGDLIKVSERMIRF